MSSATGPKARPTAATGRLRGKSAVITGAAMGIGRATAELFATEGARIVAADIDGEGLDRLRDRLGGSRRRARHRRRRRLEARGREAHDRRGGRALRAARRPRGERRSIPLRTITEATPEDWDEVMAVDGRGMFLSCKYAVEAMLKTGGGAIVCLSSISGVAGQKSQSTYGPAKFAASGLTKHLAVELADRGIRVNAVAPGTIRTSVYSACRKNPVGRSHRRNQAHAPDGPTRRARGGRGGDRLPRVRPGVVHHRRDPPRRRRLPRALRRLRECPSSFVPNAQHFLPRSRTREARH